MRRRVLAAALAAGLVAVACTGSEEPLPSGPDLVRRAAQEMRSVRSLAFAFDVEGDLGLNFVRRGQGVLSQDGLAEGVIQIEQGGSLIEYDVVVTPDVYYLKGPTGDWQPLPASLVSGFSDPTALLRPSTGVAEILAGATGAATQAVEEAGGAVAYRVRARIEAEPLRAVIPVPVGQERVEAVLWIGRDRPLLLRAEVEGAAQGPGEPVRLSIDLGEFDAPVSVTPPA